MSEPVRGPYDQVDFSVENGSYAKIVRLVGTGKRVLELGTATGRTSAVLRNNGCTVVGVEFDPRSAAPASAYCEQMIVDDLDAFDPRVLGEQRFDVILAADVLEHLKGPAALLRKLRPYLAPGGLLVASIPNIAHGSVRLALLEGRFPYADSGLLDRTHIRFFTEDGVQELMTEAGYELTEVDRVTRELHETEIAFSSELASEQVRAVLDGDINAVTYQFVVCAIPAAPDLPAVAAEATALPAPESTGTTVLVTAQARHIRDLTEQVADLMRERARERSEAAQLRQEIDSLTRQLDEVWQSESWQVAQLLRAVRRRLSWKRRA